MDFDSKMKLAVEMAHYRIELAKLHRTSILPLIHQDLPKVGGHHDDIYTYTVSAMLDLIDTLESQYGKRPNV